MRPYLAIIKDSFREALHSRVLWILLGLITLVLLGIAPLTWKIELTSKLRQEDVRNIRGFADELKKGDSPTAPAPIRRIWSQLSEAMRARLRDYQPGEDQRPFADVQLRRELVDEFNRLIEGEGIFTAADWDDITFKEEADELRQRGVESLSESERRRLDRLALEAVFPGQFHPTPDRSAAFTYLGWDLELLPQLPPDRAEEAVEQAGVVFMQLFVGFFGVFAAILVTAPIIPLTFDSGSVNLLLSKPIARPLLFLSKYFGGCSFVIVNATYLILGIWLIMGIRFGLWNPRVLWCIPIFLFLFMIYYSVSALSGLVWRSTVLAIVMTILFWFVCQVVGSAKGAVELFAMRPQRIVDLLPAGDQVFATRQNGEIVRWLAEQKEWSQAFSAEAPLPAFAPPMMNRRRLVGPVYDAQHQRLVAIKPEWAQPRILVGRRQDDWTSVDVAAAPRDVKGLHVEADGHVILIAGDGVYRLADKLEPAEEAINIFGLKLPVPAPKAFLAVSPEVDATSFADVSQAAYDAKSGALYLWNRGKLVRLARSDEDDYTKQIEIELSADAESALIAAADGGVLVAREDGVIQVLAGDSLDQRTEFVPFGANQPRQVVASPDGRWFAAVYHNDRLWLFDRSNGKRVKQRAAGDGDISSVAFTGDGRLLIADRVDRVREYQLPELKLTSQQSPKPALLQRLYRYMIKPIYTIFPKPGELESTINYALTGRESVALDGPNGMSQNQLKRDPWGPIWSSLAFTAVVLLIGCVYMRRQEF